MAGVCASIGRIANLYFAPQMELSRAGSSRPDVSTSGRGASVPRFLLSLTELQSYVTRKMPALNNAKPERTIASIALASVHGRSIPSEPKSPRRHRQIPPSRGQQPLWRLGQLTSRGPTRSRSWEQFRLCTSEDAWPPPCVGALIQSAAAKTVPPMRPRRGSGGAAGEAKSLRANPFCKVIGVPTTALWWAGYELAVP